MTTEGLLNPDGSPLAAGGAPADLIKDSDTANFVADVIEVSKEVPVIVDFWAPWCGPCKTLGPALEKVVRQAGGLVRMVKVNVDENQDLAMQLRVQSVPAVYGFKDGRPVDAFVGAVPESQIRSFIDKLTGGAKAPLDQMLDAAKETLDGGDPQGAANLYAQVLNEDPVHPGAAAGIIRCQITAGDTEGARRSLEGLPPELKNKPEIQAVLSTLDLAEQGAQAADGLEGFMEQLAKDADDHQARLDLANALFASGRTAEAIDELIELVRRDRAWNDEAGRKQLLKVFESLGNADPLTVQGRRKLSTVLFS